MPIQFEPHFRITPALTRSLLRIEAARVRIDTLPVTPAVLKGLRESARLFTTHYSTYIEGNRLEPAQVKAVLKHKGHFAGRERDEREVNGYYAALHFVQSQVSRKEALTDVTIRTIHSLVISAGRARMKPSAYRDGQNVIRDARSGAIVYLPPEAKDVKPLMSGLIQWLDEQTELPCPLAAGLVHYQFATVHPFYDGNGRTARLLTTYVLHAGGYDLKGLYSLEEYYARNLQAYYAAITVGPSHNYYEGRADADVTAWLEYFALGMADACEKVLSHMSLIKTSNDASARLRKLDAKQRKALAAFEDEEVITARQIGELFGYRPRTASALCAQWAKSGFLRVVDGSKKARKYALGVDALSQE